MALYVTAAGVGSQKKQQDPAAVAAMKTVGAAADQTGNYAGNTAVNAPKPVLAAGKGISSPPGGSLGDGGAATLAKGLAPQPQPYLPGQQPPPGQVRDRAFDQSEQDYRAGQPPPPMMSSPGNRPPTLAPVMHGPGASNQMGLAAGLHPVKATGGPTTPTSSGPSVLQPTTPTTSQGNPNAANMAAETAQFQGGGGSGGGGSGSGGGGSGGGGLGGAASGAANWLKQALQDYQDAQSGNSSSTATYTGATGTSQESGASNAAAGGATQDPAYSSSANHDGDPSWYRNPDGSWQHQQADGSWVTGDQQHQQDVQNGQAVDRTGDQQLQQYLATLNGGQAPLYASTDANGQHAGSSATTNDNNANHSGLGPSVNPFAGGGRGGPNLSNGLYGAGYNLGQGLGALPSGMADAINNYGKNSLNNFFGDYGLGDNISTGKGLLDPGAQAAADAAEKQQLDTGIDQQRQAALRDQLGRQNRGGQMGSGGSTGIYNAAMLAQQQGDRGLAQDQFGRMIQRNQLGTSVLSDAARQKNGIMNDNYTSGGDIASLLLSGGPQAAGDALSFLQNAPGSQAPWGMFAKLLGG